MQSDDSSNNSNAIDGNDDSSSSSDDSMPGLMSREETDSSDDDDGPPGLTARPLHNSSSSSDDDSDEDDNHLPHSRSELNRDRRTEVQNSDDDDSSSSSSDDSMPGLMSREETDSSDDDDDDEEPDHRRRQPPRNNMTGRQRNDTSAAATTAARRMVRHGTPQRKEGAGKKRINQHKKNKRIEQERQKKIEQERKEQELMQQRALAVQKKIEDKAATKIVSIIRMTIARRRWMMIRRRVILLQATLRGRLTRRRDDIVDIIRRLTDFRQFYHRWKDCCVGGLLLQGVILEEPDWGALRHKQAYIRQREMEEMEDDEFDAEQQKEIDERLSRAAVDAMNITFADDDDEMNIDANTDDGFDHTPTTVSTSTPTTTNIVRNIHFSDNVVKWIRNTGDQKYVQFFIRRMKQLARGERSRILAKRLVGSKNMTIYETYLEQKSGFRILWTERQDYLLVWYVAKHKSVSRLMRLIDDANDRSEQRQREVVAMGDVPELSTAASDDNDEEGHRRHHHHDDILLDPLGNVPLKVYNVPTDDIDAIGTKNWTPALHLTDDERDVVETVGTVLLLGRSGTGKTICLCNRMEFDRQTYGSGGGSSPSSSFRQLFVARSPRLCTYVKANRGGRDDDNNGSDYVTFDRLLEELERELPRLPSVPHDFPEARQMRFSTFRREVYNGERGIDALVVWTNIRSFIKGSIEAVTTMTTAAYTDDVCLSEECYLSTKMFGKKRCRLSMEQRKVVYEVYLKYRQRAAELNTWDNCDRILAVLRRLLAAKISHPELFQAGSNDHKSDSSSKGTWCRWNKIYVDEVQDYTQAEILLFFHLTDGPGHLFLAGDPAQNVTKGVEFRFDDIRSVGYHVSSLSSNHLNDRRFVPQKPKIVTVNFRSHAGVLNAAASILSLLFQHFPDSAALLGRRCDEGLFRGPRPGVFHRVPAATMAALVHGNMRGVRVLTHDECVERCATMLDDYELVYGIRKTKGLEFKSVIVLDFFSSMGRELQKPWREMLLGRVSVMGADSGGGSGDFRLKYPEIEGQLKLLYTAVTRCIDRLFFAETKSSIAGDAFVRFMTTNSVKSGSSEGTGGGDGLPIATQNKIGDIENMTMTQDEWLASGITNAEAAEGEANSGDYEQAQSLMNKAIYCFRQANHDSFARKAKIQLKSFSLRMKIFTAIREKQQQQQGTGIQSVLNPGMRMALETEAVGVMEGLLKENLLLEAKGLGRELSKVLEAQYPSGHFLETMLLRHLPGDGGYSH